MSTSEREIRQRAEFIRAALAKDGNLTVELPPRLNPNVRDWEERLEFGSCLNLVNSYIRTFKLLVDSLIQEVPVGVYRYEGAPSKDEKIYMSFGFEEFERTKINRIVPWIVRCLERLHLGRRFTNISDSASTYTLQKIYMAQAYGIGYYKEPYLIDRFRERKIDDWRINNEREAELRMEDFIRSCLNNVWLIYIDHSGIPALVSFWTRNRSEFLLSNYAKRTLSAEIGHQGIVLSFVDKKIWVNTGGYNKFDDPPRLIVVSQQCNFNEKIDFDIRHDHSISEKGFTLEDFITHVFAPMPLNILPQGNTLVRDLGNK